MKNSEFSRLAGLDFLRGIAVVGMIGYHALFLLNFYGLAVVDFGQLGMVVWARVVQFLFLGLVGVGMAISVKRAGFVKRQLKRGGLIGLMAGVVSVATFVVIPDFFVRFGILHLIAVSSVLLMWIAKWRLLVLAVGVGAFFFRFLFWIARRWIIFPCFRGFRWLLVEFVK